MSTLTPSRAVLTLCFVAGCGSAHAMGVRVNSAFMAARTGNRCPNGAPYEIPSGWGP
jgi:hypothetical protein